MGHFLMGTNRVARSGVARTEWKTPPPGLRLRPNEIHLWRAGLNPPPEHVRQLRRVLSPDERSRAGRLSFERDRRRFIVARGALRMILSRYLATEPERVTFHYGAHGKPFLSNEFDQGILQFNLSHAQELALYAFVCDRAIGVDIEDIKPVDIEAIAARFFSSRESAVLCALPETQKLDAFFNCWTCKEAYLKAKGVGLSSRLNQFDVSCEPGEPARILETRSEPQEAARWSLQRVTPAPGYRGALAVEGQGWRLKCWRWVGQ